MFIIRALDENVRTNLRQNMHKVAAVMLGLPRGELTIKEAAYCLGFQFFKNYLEKRALFDGILNIAQLANRK